MRSIGRKFYWSNCYGQRYNYETKEVEDFSFTILGNYTPKRATNYAQRKYKDNTILICNVEIEEHYHKMPAEKFLQESERVY